MSKKKGGKGNTKGNNEEQLKSPRSRAMNFMNTHLALIKPAMNALASPHSARVVRTLFDSQMQYFKSNDALQFGLTRILFNEKFSPNTLRILCLLLKKCPEDDPLNYLDSLTFSGPCFVDDHAEVLADELGMLTKITQIYFCHTNLGTRGFKLLGLTIAGNPKRNFVLSLEMTDVGVNQSSSITVSGAPDPCNGEYSKCSEECNNADSWRHALKEINCSMFYLDNCWRLIYVPAKRKGKVELGYPPDSEAGGDTNNDDNDQLRENRTLHLCSGIVNDEHFPPALAKYDEVNDQLLETERVSAEISISRDGLAALVAGLGICKNLLHLNLKECNLTEKSVHAINCLLCSCKGLVTLILDENPLGDTSFEKLLFKPMSVEVLSLKKVGITDLGLPLLLKGLEKVKKLNHLDLKGNIFTQEILQDLLPGFVKEQTQIWFILLDIAPEEGWGKDFDKCLGKNQKKGKKKFKKFETYSF